MARKSTAVKSKASKVRKVPNAPVIDLFRKRTLDLTEREREVLKLFSRGFSYVQIGETLEISSKTVGSYLQRIREKARAKNRADLITLALKEGLIGDK